MALMLLHITLWVLSSLAIGRIYLRWSHCSDVPTKVMVVSGAGIGLAALIAPLLLLNGREPLLSLRRDVEFWIIWCGVALLTGLVIWRINGFFSELQRIQQLRKQAWAQGQRGDEESTQELENARKRLEQRLRDQSGRDVVLRWSPAQLPFTIGIRHPEVFAPVWTAYEEEGVYMVSLLAHEREHISLGHTIWFALSRWISILLPQLKGMAIAIRNGLEVEADRQVLASEIGLGRDPDRYIHALESIVGPAMGAGLEVGLGHDRSNIERRIGQSLTPPLIRWRYPLMAGLVLVLQIGCHASLGIASLRDLVSLATLRVRPNYNLISAPIGIQLHSLPGKGGDFLDGLRVDSRGIKEGMVSITLVRSLAFNQERWVGFRGRVNIKVLSQPESPTSYPILMGIAGEMTGELDQSGGSQGRMVFRDFDWKPIKSSGSFETVVGRNFQGSDQISAKALESLNWTLLVPIGWEVELADVALARYAGHPRSRPEINCSRVDFFSSMPMHKFASYISMDWSEARLYNLLQ